MSGLKENVELSIDVISDILQFSTFDSQELDKERGVILQEIGMYADEPDSIVGDKFDELAYPNQPMGRSKQISSINELQLRQTRNQKFGCLGKLPKQR